ncbi:hypothetical protein chiPu_0006256 [Chiloscyllium punctatum]|uniref:Uncharacterized protein n=1 Tax=Chiloscyllium punctatum TaxID=137246 RepID=A0A401SBV0_CHIPU|nr:hypothetical protein [Chiloscyllium punctatum]
MAECRGLKPEPATLLLWSKYLPRFGYLFKFGRFSRKDQIFKVVSHSSMLHNGVSLRVSIAVAVDMEAHARQKQFDGKVENVHVSAWHDDRDYLHTGLRDS